MVGWLFRATLGLIVSGILAYTVVAVPLGRRTLLEHGVQIARTKPAQELVEDIEAAAGTAWERARTALR